DSKAKVIRQRMSLEFYGYPAVYYEEYPANIRKVSGVDVSHAAKEYVHPEQIALLVVGKEKDLDKPLSTLGPVAAIDVTIAEAGGAPRPAGGGAAAAAAALAASTPEGLALVKKVRDFVGGKAKIDAIKAVHRAGTMSMRTPQGPMDVEAEDWVQYPDMRRTVI